MEIVLNIENLKNYNEKINVIKEQNTEIEQELERIKFSDEEILKIEKIIENYKNEYQNKVLVKFHSISNLETNIKLLIESSYLNQLFINPDSYSLDNKLINIGTHRKNEKENIKKMINNIYELVVEFEKLGFLEKNIVIIGANGSGKTFYTQRLAQLMGNNGILIPGQKNLNPLSSSIDTSSMEINNQFDNIMRTMDIGKSNQPYYYNNDKFSVILKKIILEHSNFNEAVAENRMSDIEKEKGSKLKQIKKIFEILLKNKKSLNIKDLKIQGILLRGEIGYDIHFMSEGEKAMLYYIASVLLAPKGTFIIIDEPDTYLHKTILEKLWNTLEKEREDCKFIYVTHNLEFAESRNGFLKLWIKNFVHPNIWGTEKIEKNEEIPEILILEILGSRFPILFCEGKQESLDMKILTKLIGEKFTVKCVEGCGNVITYTKAWNKINNRYQSAYGLIDRDYRTEEEIEKLKTENIFVHEVAEIENILYGEKILLECLKSTENLRNENMETSEQMLKKKKNDILQEFKEKKEIHVANIIRDKMQRKIKNMNINNKNKTKQAVKNELEKIQVEVNEMINNYETSYSELIDKYDQISNYDECIKCFNEKNILKGVIIKETGITTKLHLENALINCLNNENLCNEIVEMYLPELKQITEN